VSDFLAGHKLSRPHGEKAAVLMLVCTDRRGLIARTLRRRHHAVVEPSSSASRNIEG
jgi:hypothetical protein